MGDLPPGLPGPNSRKWHNRRWWDQLGYMRVRTLTRPDASQEVDRVLRALDRERVLAAGAEREAVEIAAHAFRNFRAGRERADASVRWEAAMDALDRFLALRQERHLQEVEEAGRSGASGD